ncbi:IS66 family transposase, partial [Anaplasma marginale]|uniref:IS66 family transposase n=1 Tax=Anaplasma marginale TaxID=770 RepID=UPI0005B3AAC1
TPKAKRFTHEQADSFLCELERLSISEEHLEFAKAIIDGNKWMNEQLELGRLTIAKLRKLFQIQGSEKASLRKSAANNRKPTANKHAGGEEKASGTQNSEGKPKGHGRNSAIAYAGANVVDVKHPELAPGDLCPQEACGGRLYEMGQPGVVVRVSGAPLAAATRYDCQKMRCSICETVYTAPLPEGVSEQKYDNNFVAMLMINKYFVSMPLYRQDRLQQYLGMPLPASTQWDLMVAHEGMLKKLYQALCQDAADGLA